MKKGMRTQLIEERKARRWSQQKVARDLGTTQHNVSRWELGVTTPGAYFRAKLCVLFGKSAQELGLVEEYSPCTTTEREPSSTEEPSFSLTKMPMLWTVPYVRNPYFAGRDTLLDQIAQHFSPERANDQRRVALIQPQAIKGLGGIGKTQVAVEYAYRAQERDPWMHILWINAASEETILAGFVSLAELLPAFPAKDEKDQSKLVAALKLWLEQCQQRWLLIFDNVDDVSTIQQYLPQRGHGNLLLTTRAHAVGSLAIPLEVEKMGVMEGTQFLLHRAQRRSTTDEEINEATNIVLALDGFPLALDQAGAYIEETRCRFKDYLHLYQDHHQVLLALRGCQATDYPNSVATTWSLSFQRIEEANPATAELLHLCAFLPPDHIPEEFIQEGAAHWPPVLHKSASDLLTLNQMMANLLAFSLVKRLEEDRLLSIHRLVQVVQRDRLTPMIQQQWVERVVCALNEVFPRETEDARTWPQCLRYLELAQECDTLIQHYGLALVEGADLLNRVGRYLYEHACYSVAELLYQRSLHLFEQQSGCEHPQMATTLNNLALLYREQGKYEEAGLLYQRTLRIQEQHLEPDHVAVAMTLQGWAILYYNQGKYGEAEPLYQRVLHIREQHLGPEHLQVAHLLNNLANLYKKQGKYEDSELLQQRALRIREQHLGPEHPLVAASLNNLANLYAEQGKHKEAELLQQRALRIWEQYLGPEHPQMAASLNNLADLYREQGKYEEAEPRYQRSLQIWEQHLGPEHSDVAHPLHGLACLYTCQGKYEEAEPLYQRALHIREQQLGADHSETAETVHEFAAHREARGKPQEAQALYQRALAIRQHTLGSEHPKTRATQQRLATLLSQPGQTPSQGLLPALPSTSSEQHE